MATVFSRASSLEPAANRGAHKTIVAPNASGAIRILVIGVSPSKARGRPTQTHNPFRPTPVATGVSGRLLETQGKILPDGLRQHYWAPFPTKIPDARGGTFVSLSGLGCPEFEAERGATAGSVCYLHRSPMQ